MSKIYNEDFKAGCREMVELFQKNPLITEEQKLWTKFNIGAYNEPGSAANNYFDDVTGTSFSSDEALEYCNCHNMLIPTMKDLEELNLQYKGTVNYWGGKKYINRERFESPNGVIIPASSNSPGIWVMDENNNVLYLAEFVVTVEEETKDSICGSVAIKIKDPANTSFGGESITVAYLHPCFKYE